MIRWSWIPSSAVLLLASCGQKPVAPLTDSPQWLAAQKAQQFEASGKALGRAQAEDVERHLAEAPDDLTGRQMLLLFYAGNGTRFYDPAFVIAARRKHILWLIEHHPELPLLGQRPGLIDLPIDQLADPQGYAQIKKEWLALAAKPDAPLPVLGNAAAFLAASDKPLAEKFLQQARERDPQGPWGARLGALYASALTDTSAAYADHVRQAVAAAIDPELLANVHHRKPADGSIEALAQQAIVSYSQGDPAGFDTARKSALEVTRKAPGMDKDSDAGTALYQADMLLGLLAARDHDRKAALKYLQDAAGAPVTEDLAYFDQPITYPLLSWLLKDGERDSVIRFLEQFAKTSSVDRAQLLESAALIRKGQKPVWYPTEPPS
ncbi:MAG: hypothetical protein P4L56_07960 [Candidatus Sulfopaludibacter sp.]|nr:hypothetical protein [Candidatus Sulfopaludibacter sp.]